MLKKRSLISGVGVVLQEYCCLCLLFMSLQECWKKKTNININKDLQISWFSIF